MSTIHVANCKSITQHEAAAFTGSWVGAAQYKHFLFIELSEPIGVFKSDYERWKEERDAWLSTIREWSYFTFGYSISTDALQERVCIGFMEKSHAMQFKLTFC